MEKEIFFHIGLSKTGTKFFQDKIFPKLKNITYIPKRKYYKVFEVIEKANSNKIITSQELDQQFDNEIDIWSKKYPQTKIIMVLRRQDSWFVSQYKRFVKNGFTGSLKDFIDIFENKGYFKIEDGFYFPKIQKILKQFSSEALILNYDDLKKNPLKFIEAVLKFLEADLNTNKINLKPKHTSYNDKQLKVMLKYGKKFGVKIRKYNDENRLIRFFQRVEQMLPRYFILYVLSNFVSEKNLSHIKLIDEKYVEEIKNFYKEDWEKSLSFTEKIH